MPGRVAVSAAEPGLRRVSSGDMGMKFMLTKDAKTRQTAMDLFEEVHELPYQSELREYYDRVSVQLGVAFLIFCNFLVEAGSTQMNPEEGDEAYDIFLGFDFFFTILFTIEIAWNLYGHWWWDFWRSEWNIFDFVVVVISLLSLALPNLPGITVLRLFRAFRIFRLFKRIKSLKKIIQGVLNAIPGVSEVFVVTILLMGIWSVIGVEFFRDHEDQQFGTFLKAMFSLTEVMTGTWAGTARTLIYEHDLPLASLYYITFIFVVGIVMTNVVVAILLDKYLSAMDNDDDAAASLRRESWPQLYVEVGGMLHPMRKISWPQFHKFEGFVSALQASQDDTEPTTDTISTKPLHKWGTKHVGVWLDSVGFSNWKNLFRTEGIDGPALSILTSFDLEKFGMKFGERKVFQRAIHQVIAGHAMELKKLKKLRAVFKEYDTDGDGVVDPDEFLLAWRQVFDQSVLTDEDIMEIFHDMDTDKSGDLTFEDFRRAMRKGHQEAEEAESEVEMERLNLSGGHHGDHSTLCKSAYAPPMEFEEPY